MLAVLLAGVIVVALAVIAGGVAVTVRFIRQPESNSRLIGGVTGGFTGGVIAGLLAGALIGLLISQTSAGAVNGSATNSGGSGNAATQSPTATAGPTATPSPAPIPTLTPIPTATATPLPQPPYVLCQSGASDNWSGWSVGGHWSVLNGLLLSDGSGGDSTAPLMAPCQPPAADYRIDATIKIVSVSGCCGAYGLDVRAVTTSDGIEGYSGYNDPCLLCSGAGIIYIGGDARNGPLVSSQSAGVYDTNWHTYGVEAIGNTINLLIDGTKILTLTDNKYLSAGSVGIWSQDQVEVMSVKVTMLP